MKQARRQIITRWVSAAVLALFILTVISPFAEARRNRGGDGQAPGENVGKGKGCTMAGEKFKSDGWPILSGGATIGVKRVTLIMRWSDANCDDIFDLVGEYNDLNDFLRVTPRFTITLTAPLTLPVGTYTISTFNFGPIDNSLIIPAAKESSLWHVRSDDLLPGGVLPGDFIVAPCQDCANFADVTMAGELFSNLGAPDNVIPDAAYSWGIAFTITVNPVLDPLTGILSTEKTFDAGTFFQGDSQLNIYGVRITALGCELGWSESYDVEGLPQEGPNTMSDPLLKIPNVPDPDVPISMCP